MKKANKNWFTLFELIIVISLILLVFVFAAKNQIWSWILPALYKQTTKDFIVTTVDETRQYSYNNITIWQELLKDQLIDETNIEVSRFNWQKWKGNNNVSKVAYYHWLYFTTDSNDNISTTSIDTNKFLYLLQYRQEWYQNLNNRIFENFNIDYNTSNQVLSFAWTKWSKKYKIPTWKTIYLNKLIKWNISYEPDLKNACRLYSSEINHWYILFSIANMNYKFYKENSIDNSFDYVFCYSDDPDEYNEKGWFWLRINRARLEEFSLASIRNY